MTHVGAIALVARAAPGFLWDHRAVSTEAEFHVAMVKLYETAKRELSYNATSFLAMVSEHGGVETAHRLLATDKPSEGFTTLWSSGRLDLSVEAHVLDTRFDSLFSDDERRTALRRLEQYGYRPEPWRG